MADRYLFVTGKLAAPALRETLRRADLPFDYDVAVMKITVAALMTPDWIARRLEVPPEVTQILIPGLCQGDPAVLSEQFGVPAAKGPADLKRLPAFFGQADARSRYGMRDIRVFAEINNVPHLDREQIVAAATYYRDAGADVIDLGLSLDRNWLEEGPGVIGDLKARGFTLSIDTLDPEEILMADAAGVDYVLSLTGQNLHVARHLRATPVLIPDTPDDLDSLDGTIAHQEGTPPKHVDGRLLTIKDEDVRPYSEAELRDLHASITDPNIRIFSDADWIYAFNAEQFVKGTDINQIFDELGVDEHTHAFYLGKELMKASIARGLGKNYRQESPLDWGYLTFDEPRRERVRLTARLRGPSDDGSTEEGS